MTTDTSADGQTDGSKRAGEIRRVTLIGALVNLVLAVLKVIFGVLANSQSLLADGVHSISDLLSDGLVYYAAHHAHQEPDEDHPYGHGRFETAATLGLSLFLFLVAAGLIWDAANRLFAPDSLLVPEMAAVYVALFSVVSKEWLYHYTRIAANRVGSDMMRANAWHHRSDAVSSIVVLVGVAGTMAGLPYLDAIAAVIVGIMIAKIGWELGWGSMQELVDTGLDADRISEIRRTILSVGGVRDIHMLRTRRIGGAAAADVHVMVEPRISVSEGHMISVMVEQQLKIDFDEIKDVTVHIDPEDDETAPTCLGLPLRAEALSRIDECWRELPEVSSSTELVLHYLSGRIDLDVYIPAASSDITPEIREHLRERLQSALARYPEFGRLRLLWM